MEVSLSSPTLTVPSVARVRSFHAALCQLAQERFASSLAGKFVLADSLSRGGDTFVLAANIAGAASLTPESDSSAIRYAIRNGIVDFAVTHPDEALRILKNELRKQQPVCVCLEWKVAEVLANLAERGAQPDILAWSLPDEPIIKPFLARGAAVLSLVAEERPPLPGRLEVEWSAPEPVGSSLRRVDALVTTIIPAVDWERQSWIASAPKYLPRQLRSRRCIALTHAEVHSLERALKQKLDDGEIDGPVELRVGNAPPTSLQRTL